MSTITMYGNLCVIADFIAGLTRQGILFNAVYDENLNKMVITLTGGF